MSRGPDIIHDKNVYIRVTQQMFDVNVNSCRVGIPFSHKWQTSIKHLEKSGLFWAKIVLLHGQRMECLKRMRASSTPKSRY